MPRRKPVMNYALVAFVDVLGVKKKLEQAKTNGELQAIFDQISMVHQEFEKETDRDIKKFQQFSKKRMLALSDALLVAVDLGSNFVRENGFLPVTGMLLSELALSQASCVLRGVFLRGGISLGQFFFSRDILVSKAMLEAYELEHSGACYPVLVIEENLRQLLAAHPQQVWYGREGGPARTLLYRYRAAGKTQYCLHYLRVVFESCDAWDCSADREAYRAEKDERKKQRIMDRSYFKSAKNVLMRHKRIVSSALRASRDRGVRRKYEWLVRYHNRFVAGLVPGFASCAIRMTRRRTGPRRVVK